MANPVKLRRSLRPGWPKDSSTRANGRPGLTVGGVLPAESMRPPSRIVAGNIRPRSAGHCASFGREDGFRRWAPKGKPRQQGRLEATGALIPTATRCGWPNHTRVFHNGPSKKRLVLESGGQAVPEPAKARDSVRP